jgi:PAS domain S-box-containing protein/diguanylate cyclase (GGDEF)-like protein
MKNKSSKVVECNAEYPIYTEEKSKEDMKQTQLLNEYKKAVDQSTIVSKTDKNGVIIYVNDAFVKVSGYSKDELIGSSHNIIRHPDNPSEIFKVMWKTILNKESWHGILKNRAKDGSIYYVDTTITPILTSNGEIEELIAIRHNITKVFEQEQLINRQLIDTLTGLPNRLKLLKDLEKKQHHALTIFNLNAFQEINKLYGYKVGDEILKKVAVYLSETLDKEEKQIYKLPGDMFAILCIETCNEDACKEIITPFIQEFSENLFRIGEHEIYLNMTAGVSYGNDIDILINANIALNNAKKFKLPFAFYDLTEEDEEYYVSSQKMIKTLKYAISNDLVIPYFQPIYNNKTLKVDKYEVLMRIINEAGEVISPLLFLDISHKARIYPELTKIIIRKAFEMFQYQDITFTINISIEDIRNTLTQTYIIDMISRFNRPHNIVLEIVESEEIEDYNQIKAFVKEIKKYGVKIAIDDFGSGYSNFMHLLELETNFIKIDGSIIKNILHDRNSQILTETIVSMANKLNIKIIAEYVSSYEIYNAVTLLGIDHAQGCYLGEPKPHLLGKPLLPILFPYHYEF